MNLLLFELSGDLAMWRNVYESMGSFSCIGPAPGNLAGLFGAALGFASPRSQAAENTDQELLKCEWKKGLPWPLSPELLAWEEANDLKTACRWTGGFPARVPWNINGCKEINKSENLRLQQQVILNPRYDVAVKLAEETEARRLKDALQCPAFPLCLGASFCRAIVRNVRLADAIPDGKRWAFRSGSGSLGEVVPLSRHIVDPAENFERIVSEGYWVYPVPDNPDRMDTDPFERTWIRRGKKTE